MAVRIRLWQQGCKNRTSYRIVVADSRFPRDGKYLEAIGWYQPCNKTLKWTIQADRLQYWMGVGAQLSDTVCAIAKKQAPEVMQEFFKKKATRQKRKA